MFAESKAAESSQMKCPRTLAAAVGNCNSAEQSFRHLYRFRPRLHLTRVLLIAAMLPLYCYCPYYYRCACPALGVTRALVTSRCIFPRTPGTCYGSRYCCRARVVCQTRRYDSHVCLVEKTKLEKHKRKCCTASPPHCTCYCLYVSPAYDTVCITRCYRYSE